MKNYLINKFYYFWGLLICPLNNIRHRLLGHIRPRPILPSRIGENILYEEKVMAQWEKRFQKYTGDREPFKNKDVLEIGPGQDLGTGLIVLSRGARSYTALDRFPILVNNVDFYKKLHNKLNRNICDQKTRKNLQNILATIEDQPQQNIKLPFFEYVTASAENIDQVMHKKFDIVFSQAVAQHLYGVEKAFRGIYKVLKRGGVMCHRIDFRTTMSGGFREWDPLIILRYSDFIYENFMRYPGAPNRLRVDDYVKIAKEAGFDNIHIRSSTQLSSEKIKDIKSHLAKRFQSKNNESLRVLSTIFLAQKY